MSKGENKTLKRMTPMEVVQKNNPLIKGLSEASKKWNKRWPDIEQPWPVEGTLNPDVIQTISTLVTAYKANEKKGKRVSLVQKKDELSSQCCNFLIKRGRS